MKKLYVSVLSLLLSTLSFAQLKVALLGGPQWASVKESNSIPGWDTVSKPFYGKKTGINIGLLAEMPLGNSRYFYFQPGVFYSAKGRKYDKLNDTATAVLTDTLRHNATLSTNYIEVPLNLALKLPLGKKSNFLLSAGPYLGFFFNGKNTSEVRAYSNNKFTKESADLQVGKGIEKVKTLDFGLNARAGFELNKILITAFYTQGIKSFYTASYEGDFKHQTYGISVGFWLNSGGPRKPRDKDKDGVPDEQDACPEIAGTAATNGCPDRDADLVADNADKCPDVAGLARYNGCPVPDTDKDGVNDEEDKCPDLAGTAKYSGCPVPDTDKDGINDEADACPDKPGVAEFKGCPVPDSDGDGLNDKEDKCPAEAGTKENNGCPEIKKEIVEKVNYAARNIFFDKNSDKLLAKSFASLDEVAKILNENPALRLSIEGHTDNVGKASYNLALSQKRANAVRDYLLRKGIEPARLKSEGFGQERPVGDNNTMEGKTQNRRVELKLEQD